jgi:uridylate kinase
VTTDTAAALRAMELNVDILMKATRVDGVYSEDPERNPHAVLYSELKFSQVLEKGLRVMDSTAISHCMEHNMPIMIFNFRKDGNITKAVMGKRVGTVISHENSDIS